MRVRQLNKDSKVDLSEYPNFFSNGSIIGMKRMYYGKDCLLVKSKGFIYNVTRNPQIYWDEAH